MNPYEKIKIKLTTRWYWMELLINFLMIVTVLYILIMTFI